MTPVVRPAEAARARANAAQAGDYLSHWRRSQGDVQAHYVHVDAQGTTLRTDVLQPLFGNPPRPTGWELDIAGPTIATLAGGPPVVATVGIAPLAALVGVVAPNQRRLWVEHEASWTPWTLARETPNQEGVFARLKKTLTEIARELATPRRHAGVEAVDWLKDFLGASRDTTLMIGQVSSATYYSWKQRPNSAVRPKTVARLLRVTATLRLLERSIGRAEASDIIRRGSPSYLDRLQDDGGGFEQVLEELATMAAPQVSRRPRRLTGRKDALAQLAALEEEDSAHVDLRPLGSARELRVDELGALASLNEGLEGDGD